MCIRDSLEYSYKNDELGDPLINDYHAIALGLATREELDQIAAMTFAVNDALREIFEKVGIILVDFKIEFGRCPALGGKIDVYKRQTPLKAQGISFLMKCSTPKIGNSG